ncbi:MAG: class I SAM-dependent methyltransferase, partial [Nitrospirales bacterium]|nr:class I SAM-dependent methyltransferase [Nitrospirales bacterium]
PMLNTLLDLFSDERVRQATSDHDLKTLRDSFGDAISLHTIQGWAYHKPLGYAGDYQIIDKIYTYAESPHAHLAKWDRYFHAQKAPQAVRNRQSFLLDQIWQISNERTSRSSILNLASGPGRDLHEALKVIGPAKVQIDCVDQDIRAIDYAKKLCQDFLSHIRFIPKNVFRFIPDKSYDLIWSAGLFDYFHDTIFKRTINRLKTFLNPMGKMVIGNFSENNPTRGYMELFNWNLIHRSPDRLKHLASECGFADHQIHIDREPEGVNLFLVLTAN